MTCNNTATSQYIIPALSLTLEENARSVNKSYQAIWGAYERTQKYTILFFNVYTEHHVSCLSSLPLQAESITASLYHTFQHIYISPTIQHNQCLSHMLMFSRTPVFHQYTTFSFSSATIFTACSFSTPFSNPLPPLLSQQGFTPFWV